LNFDFLISQTVQRIKFKIQDSKHRQSAINMAVLRKLRERWLGSWSYPKTNALSHSPIDVPLFDYDVNFDVRPLTLTQLEEVWKLDLRCFLDGEAYTRDTFEYLLTSAEGIAYRAVLQSGVMIGFVCGVLEPDHTGHITTIGVAPECRRRGVAQGLLSKIEDGFRKRDVRIVRLEVRSVNTTAQQLYRKAGYTVTQRLPKYYSNGGDGLLMVKSLD
jgi:ribosomal-protein-alanine acetyltransferase